MLNIINKLPFNNDQFELICSSHVIEHVGSTGQLRKLKQLI